MNRPRFRTAILLSLLIASFSTLPRLFAQNASQPWLAFAPYENGGTWWSSPAAFIHYLQSEVSESYVIIQPPGICYAQDVPSLYLVWTTATNQYSPTVFCMQYQAGTSPISVCPDGATVPAGENCPGKSEGYGCQCGSVQRGNPIDVGSGNKFEEEVDYETTRQNKLRFVRYYNSLAANTIATTLGGNWRSNFDRYIQLTSSTSVLVERPDGQQLTFALTNGIWTPDTDVDITLTNSGATWILTDHADNVETYTSTNGLVANLNSIESRNGYTQTLTYNPSKQVAAVTDSYGRALSFAYNGSTGLLQSVTTPDNLVITFGFTPVSAGNQLTSVTYSTSPPTSRTYLYENSSLPFALTGIIDENGNRYATWTYDANARGLSSAHGASGLNADLTTITYNDSNGSRTVTNALGVTDTYTFTTLQNMPKVAQVSRAATSTTPAATESFAYDSNGYLASKTDWNGNQTAFVNDLHGDPTTLNEAVGTSVARTTTLAYDSIWVHLPDSITTVGVTATFTYDSQGEQLTKTLTDTTSNSSPYSTNGQARTWTNTWANSLLASVQTPNGGTTTFSYDGTGALTAITDPLQHVTQMTSHTGGGLPEVIVDPNGVVTTWIYDGRQRPTSSTVSGTGGTFATTWAYDAAGNLITTTLPDNSYLTNAYDTADRLTQVTDALGNYVTFTLDPLGDRTQSVIFGHAGAAWQRAGTFDALGRLLVDTQGAGQTTTKTYDPNGNVLTITDGLQHTTTNTYDALNRLSASTDANGGVTTPAYDAHDRVVSVQDGNGNTTSYVRDGFGEVIGQTSPDSGNTVLRYDSDGNQTSKTDALSIVTNQTFDALDRVLTTAYPADPSENVSYTYDQTAAGFSFGIGRLTSVTDTAGSLTRAYEERGNLASEQRVSGTSVLTTAYTYDGASRIATMTYPDGTLVSNQYNVAGYLTTVSATLAGSGTTTTIATLGHLPFGPINGATYGNGIAEAWANDASYRPTNITDGLSGAQVQNVTYAYDNANNVQSITDAVNPANSQTLGYDVINRLTSAVSGANGYGTFAWTYDKVGNRLTQVQGSTTTTYTYASGTNRLADITVSISSAQLRTIRSLTPQSSTGISLYAHAPLSVTPMPLRRRQPSSAVGRSASPLLSALGWPSILIGIGGIVRFRKRLRDNLFITVLCCLALTLGSAMLWTGHLAALAATAKVKVATPLSRPPQAPITRHNL